MANYDDFHREWMQRIYEVADSKNLLWKQVYLAALPSKYVDYFKAQGIFQMPYETYTWGEIYSIITSALVGLCTSTKVNKSIQKMSRFPDSKSICAKYGLSIEDPIRRKRKAKKILKRIRSVRRPQKNSQFGKPPNRFRKRAHYKRVPNTHYYTPNDIKLKTFKAQEKKKLTCWLCGQPGHLANRCPQGEA